MNWAAWGSLLGAALAGTVLAITFYFHWSFRYSRAWMGVVSEVALGLFLALLGLAAILYLLGHHP